MSYYVAIQPQRGVRFSRVEITHILVAVAVLTAAFTLSLAGGIEGAAFLLNEGGGAILAFLAVAALIAVLTAFLFHELAHKVVAQRHGCFAEFRYYPMGLVIGLITGAFGFIFAAPGAVMIAGSVGPRENVRISAAGPATNLSFAAAFIGLAVVLGYTGPLVGDDLLSILVPMLISVVAFVNLFLAGFNLIPFPPLDGSKIFAWNKPLWVGMVAAAVGLFALGFFLDVLLF